MCRFQDATLTSESCACTVNMAPAECRVSHTRSVWSADALMKTLGSVGDHCTSSTEPLWPVSGDALVSHRLGARAEFLAMLGERYQAWITTSRADPRSGWCHDGLTVVFSGADVVGEGEQPSPEASTEWVLEEVHESPGLGRPLVALL